MSPFRYFFRRALKMRMQVASDANPEISALAATSIPVVANIVVLVQFVAWYLDSSVLRDAEAEQILIGAVLVVLTVFVIQYRLWVANGRWRSIANEEIAEAAPVRRVRSVLIVAYLVATLLAIPVLGWIRYNFRH